jgi:hypothetical protein
MVVHLYPVWKNKNILIIGLIQMLSQSCCAGVKREI